MNTQEREKAIEDIRMAIANDFQNVWKNQVLDIYQQSRRNKGGSITVPKKFVDKLDKKLEATFFDLDVEDKRKRLQVADQIISTIKLILRVEDSED